eukprot:COSAG05_NODE_1671_length_4303_cov_2.550666_6_plen_62_part_00
MAGIDSQACQLHVPALMWLLPRELPELYAKPYSLTVNLQTLGNSPVVRYSSRDSNLRLMID